MSEDVEAQPPFVIEAARIGPGRPPSARLTLEVEIANRLDHARWALLPGQLPTDEGGVFGVETVRLAGTEATFAARILGRGGRLGVRVAARSRVRLRDVGITWWGRPPSRIDVVLTFADEVSIAATPLADWLGAPSRALPDGSTVSFARAVTTDSRTTEGLESVPLILNGAVVTASASAKVEPA